MKMLSLLTLLLLLTHTGFAQAPVAANATLEAVTVYSSGAEMNHKARISLPAGSSEVLINNVAETLDEQSIRIGSTANITIMSVRFTRNHLDEEKESPAYLAVQDSQKVVARLISRLDNERKAEQKVLELLDKNNSLAGSQTGMNVTDLVKMVDYYKSKQLEAQNHIASLNEQIAALNANATRLNGQLQELSRDPRDAGGQLLLQVMANTAATSDFNISYISPNAGWRAFYDLRAASTASPLQLFYKANVVQSTGIDWKKVKLKLATGNPSRSGTAPEPQAWFLRFREQQQYAAVSGSSYLEKRSVINAIKALDGVPGIQNTSGGGQPGDDPQIQMRGQGSMAASASPMIVVDGTVYEGSYSSINPQDIATVNLLKDATAGSLYGARGTNGVILITTKSRNLSNYTTTAEHELNTTFDIDIPYDIVSNDKPHSVSLKEYSIPASYQYYAMPRADEDAFLVAGITGYEKLGLLPGEANIIFENMYIGKSFISPGITTDTLGLSLGRDRKISITREQVAGLNTTRYIGNTRRQTFTYEIQVRNGKKEAISLTLKDQYPISTDKSIEVELLDPGQATINKETGMLEWKLQLAPGESRKVRFSYAVKYPRAQTLANL